jgi:hypothetical protein
VVLEGLESRPCDVGEEFSVMLAEKEEAKRK